MALTYAYFQQQIRRLADIGFFEVVVPFVLVYVLVYAILVKTDILKIEGKGKEAGSQSKKIYMFVALTIALLFIVPHALYAGTKGDGVLTAPFQGYPDPVEVINSAIPSITIWLVVILMFMLVAGMTVPFGGEKVLEQFEGWGPYIAAASGIVVIYIFGVSAGFWPNLRRLLGGLGSSQPLLSSPNAIAMLIVLVVIIIIVYVSKE